MTPSSDNTFCWYPFSLLALKEWSGRKGITGAAPCCNSIRPETPDPLNVKHKLLERPHDVMPTDIFHGEEMESIRQAMREGRRHSACNTCWRMEDRAMVAGTRASSYRMFSSPGGLDELSAQEKVELIDSPELRSIDFAFGENCNLRCRMCTPGLSNKLRLDFQYFYNNNVDTQGMGQFDTSGQTPDNNIDLRTGSSSEVYHFNTESPQWKNILDNIHTLKHIRATGGETLLSKGFIEFLDTAIERDVAQNIFLEFHTNATKFTDANIEKLVQFDGMHLNLSIDSLGKNYEYIRYPMPWDKLNDSLLNLIHKVGPLKHPKTNKRLIKNFSFNVVFSALNAHYIPDLFYYQRDLVLEHQPAQHANMFVDLLWPEDKYISVKYLPRKIKENLIFTYTELMKKYMDEDDRPPVRLEISNAINFLNDNLDYEPTEQDRQNMLREITAFDKSRKQCYKDYLHRKVVEFLETPL